jgi:imidazoleglycerol phosphate dehydratase HisB
MRKHTISKAQLTELKISIPHDLQQQAHHIAKQQGETLSEIVRMALATYIDRYSKQHRVQESRLSLEEARLLMLELGRGLGNGQPPHNGARRHDEYLYSHK